MSFTPSSRSPSVSQPSRRERGVACLQSHQHAGAAQPDHDRLGELRHRPGADNVVPLKRATQ